MVDTADFDAFYADARERLLHQTYALTGDLPAAQHAVRDAFVAAWNHWRKVSRLDDPERWARPVAWAHAQRRSGARIWHRDKSDDPAVTATLDALATLTHSQRRVLLLSTLTPGSMEDLAREAGLPLDTAERELQSATARFSAQRGVEAGLVRLALESLRGPCAGVTWPRVTIVRRAGTTRRRTHTLLGVAAAVALVVGGGAAAGYDGKAHPRLDIQRAEEQPTPTVRTAPPAPPPELSAAALLSGAQVRRLAPALRWSATTTDTNLEGGGLVLPCQQARFADVRSSAALVRTFAASPAKGKGAPAAGYQMSELSKSTQSAHQAYLTALGWYAGCADPQVQLIRTLRVDGVGDEATLLTMRAWGKAPSALVVGVARTGQVTTTTLGRLPGAARVDVERAAALLAAAVNDLCGFPGTGTCAAPPTLVARRPVPVGAVPAMLSEVDLPPVTSLSAAWVGTEPRRALTNTAATQCDFTDFGQPPMSNAWTRTFLFPQADLPDTFGLTETVGTMPARAADAFVEQLRRRMSTCEDRNLGTTVVRVAQESTRSGDLSVWHVIVEISDQQSVSYQMGVVRTGTAVAQVGFTPSTQVRMRPGDFAALVRRAQERLTEMPAPEPADSAGSR